MEKTKIGPHGFLYPMPMVIVGADAGGKPVETYCSPDVLMEGKPDVARMRPFTLTMPDNRYWAVGAQIGKAWSDGRGFPAE